MAIEEIGVDSTTHLGEGKAETPLESATRGWSSRLARLVTAFLAVQSITGLWIYLAPFSVGSQIQVLLHTVLGLTLLLPCVYYQWRHLLVWYAQKASVVMVLGYVLMLMVLACLASGVVVAWQAAAGPRLTEAWDVIHLVSGFGVCVTVGGHLAMAFLRRRVVARRDPAFRRSVGRFAAYTASGVLSIGVAVVAAVLVVPDQQWEFDPPRGYQLSAYLEQHEEYRGNPFAPSYARTASGKLVDPRLLSQSSSCGTSGCHEQILAEWEPSAHRFSAMNPPFQAIQKNFAADRDPAETRYCAGCHDPISLFAGAKDIHNLSLSAPGMQEGISCVVCHTLDKVDVRGNADYVLVPPEKYLWESTSGWTKFVSDFLIRAYPRQHLADYDRTILRTAESCGACHKQFIPEALNRFGLVGGQNQYDEWRQSHWHVDDVDKNLSCVDCHMRLVCDSRDPGKGEAGAIRRSPHDGAHRHHGMVAANFFMPDVLKLPGHQEQVRLTHEWLRGETVIPEIDHLWPRGPVASLEIIAPDHAETGDEVQVRVIVGNRKAGHALTTGPLDFIRTWIHLTVHDASGQVVAEWGGIDPQTREITDSPGKIHQIGNSRKEGTLVLEGQPIDGEGKPILKHELWRSAGGKGKRVIFPGYADNQVYSFRVPRAVQGPLAVRAELNYRRYRQEFLNLVLPTMEKESGVYQPTVTQAAAEKSIAVTDAALLSATPTAGQDG